MQFDQLHRREFITLLGGVAAFQKQKPLRTGLKVIREALAVSGLTYGQ
jgi:hypothetical protein